MNTKASSKVSSNANSAAKTTREWWGVIFTNSLRREGEGEVVRGKLQTNTVRFVCFFSQLPKKPESVIHSDSTTTSVCNCRLTKEKKGEKNTMQLPLAPPPNPHTNQNRIKQELVL